MRKQLIMVSCVACLALAAQGQTSSDSSSSGSPANQSSGTSSGLSGNSGSSTSPSGWSSSLSPTGRMSHQDLRASQLTGAQVTSSSSGELGTISDVIINPNSGRIDFAVLSLNSSGASSSSSPSGSTSSASSTSSTSSAGGKQVAVPWMLLRANPSGSSSSTTTSTGSSGGQTSFVFNGDASKLSSAPSFDPNTDLTQPSWRQSVFSYFGLSSHGMATGAAESPGSSYGGSSSSESSGSQGSSGSSTSPGSSSSGTSGTSGSSGSSTTPGGGR